MRDFAGLENVDAATAAALMNFSYYLACGNTDDAYKSVKGVSSKGVWESMAKMCVKTGRLDVAQKCLGQMQHAQGAAALRECEEPQEQARLAIVATHLNMTKEAEHLYTACERWDLLNTLHQSNGEWEKAIGIAKSKDRIHLRTTYFNYAQHLEALGNVQEALRHYELSETARTEAPRLLCSLGDYDELENYISQAQDAKLYRWYAQYLESKQQLDAAANAYRKAEDWLSLVRIACFYKDVEKAMQICHESGDKAACYHLGRHFEQEGEIKKAIHYFASAGRVQHALRLAQQNNMENDLMSLALSSTPSNMNQAARYYEQNEQFARAVTLYQKAGNVSRALELCFKAELFDSLRKIADDLNADCDPEVLARCAEFFMQHEQHDKAVHLLSISKQFERAVDLCCEHNVKVTDDMAERMTPDKAAMEATSRANLLLRMAKLCKKQGSFQLACKKFTQAGDKVKAMKCLLKCGDTEKIAFFAGTARQPEIYVLAANYMQSLDWHNDPEIMKQIITFYSKAKAYDKLSAFYDACAQVEIDEYRDYEKAVGALRESHKFLVKSNGTTDQVSELDLRISLVERFAEARRLAKTDADKMVQCCQELLQEEDIEAAVRVGDVYAQLVEHYITQQDNVKAHKVIEQMRQRQIILSPYLDKELVEQVYAAVGEPVPREENENAVDEVGDDIDEEIRSEEGDD